MDPITLMAIGMGLQVFGRLRQGMSSKMASEYDAEVMLEAIRQEEIKADLIADKLRREKRRVGGAQVARYLKAGVKLEGTPLEVMADTAAQFEEDLAITDYNKRVAISRLRAGIAVKEIEAKEAMPTAIISAGATVLQGWGMYKAGGARISTPYGYWGG